MKQTIRVLHLTDDKDRHIVQVPFYNTSGCATVYADDFDELMAIGLSPMWSFRRNRIWVYLPGLRTQGSVVRVLMNADKGQIVLHLNEDHTDLRRDNLRLSAGNARNRDRSFLDPIDAYNPRRPLLSHIYAQTQTNGEPGGISLGQA